MKIITKNSPKGHVMVLDESRRMRLDSEHHYTFRRAKRGVPRAKPELRDRRMRSRNGRRGRGRGKPSPITSISESRSEATSGEMEVTYVGGEGGGRIPPHNGELEERKFVVTGFFVTFCELSWGLLSSFRPKTVILAHICSFFR